MNLRSLPARFKASIAGPPLDPPPTASEEEWWLTAKPPIRRREILRTGLLIQLPVWAGNAAKNGFHALTSTSGILFLLGGGAVAFALAGWVTWAASQPTKMRAAIITKRLREGLLTPAPSEEDLPESA